MSQELNAQKPKFEPVSIPEPSLRDLTDDVKNVTGLSEALEAVQKELVYEKDARKEERFLWLVAVILLFDIFQFKDMETWSGPFIVGFIEVIVITALGRKWGMDLIWTLTERIIDKWDGKINSK